MSDFYIGKLRYEINSLRKRLATLCVHRDELARQLFKARLSKKQATELLGQYRTFENQLRLRLDASPSTSFSRLQDMLWKRMSEMERSKKASDG